MKYKSMKVFLWGKRLRDVYPHCTRWELFKYRFAKFMRYAVGITIWALVIAFITLMVVDNKTVVQQVIVERKPVDVEYPVLDRIAQCESGNRHYGETGQVLVMGNTNKTVDVGRFQINTVWFKKATELGLNVFDEKDNRLMAEYIYKNFGTEAWVYSKHCWNK
jgi:hypothetical protein